MSTELFIGFAVLVIAAGLLWRLQTANLARRLFGPEHRIRYVHNRWVIEAEVAGHTVRYTTGGMGFFPALTYLLVESPISEPYSVVEGESAATLPESVQPTLRSISAGPGFRRLDALGAQSTAISALGRVSWIHPGEGILLRRFTRAGGDTAAVTADIEALLQLARDDERQRR